MNGEYRRPRPSFFFPIALITVGVVWLLVNNGAIPVESIYRLLPLWPVLLIAGGLSILLRRLWWPLSPLLWLGIAALFVWLLVAAPALLPRVSATSLRHMTLQEPLDQAKSASVQLNLSIYRANIHPLKDSTDLVYADIYSSGEAHLNASGSAMKNVDLVENMGNNFDFWNFGWVGGMENTWDIGLTPKIPLQLKINTGTGRTDADLSSIQLESLNFENGTGSAQIQLPQNQASFPFSLSVGTGSVTVNVPQNTAFNLTADGGTGSLRIHLPQGAGVQVNVTSGGLGGINLPGFTKVSGGSGKEGVYENSAFSSAKQPIIIRANLGTGSLTVQ